jgi:hypothetical protein
MNARIDIPQGLEVTFREKEVISYEKTVSIVKDGITILADLHYDNWDGYEISWRNMEEKEIEEPQWATDYAELTSYHELAYLLDEMGVER